MKFVALALTAVLGLTEATSLKGKSSNNQKFTTKLFKNAKPFGKENARKLEDGQEFQITGDHSIVFNSCETLSIQADLGDDENGYLLQQMYENGQLKPQKSYILFDVCESATCFTGGDRTTMITDMAAFIDAFAEFIPMKQQEYCEACDQQEQYCMSQLYGNGQQYGYYNGGNRRVQENQSYEYINCDRCEAYGCYSYQQEDNDWGMEWIQSLTECKQSEYPYYFNGVEVSMGFMCNQAGTGVEIAAFMDDECTMYTNQVSFTDVMSQTDSMYWSNTKDQIEYMFGTGFSCYNPEVTYINPYDEANGEYGDEYYQYQAQQEYAAQYGQNYAQNYNENGEQQEYQAPEAAEWCQSVFEGDLEVVDMETCGYNANNQDANNQNEQQQGDEANYYTQQTFTLYEDDVDNSYAVCKALNKNGGEGEHIYDKSGSGSLYKYKNFKNKQSSDNWEKELDKKHAGSKGFARAFWVVALLVAGGAGIAFFVHSKGGFSADKKEPMLKTDENGTLA